MLCIILEMTEENMKQGYATSLIRITLMLFFTLGQRLRRIIMTCLTPTHPSLIGSEGRQF